MNYDFIDKYLISKKGVTKDFKEEWNWERYKVDDKCLLLFATIQKTSLNI